MNLINTFLFVCMLLNAVGVAYFLHKFQVPWQAYLSLAAVTWTAVYFYFEGKR